MRRLSVTDAAMLLGSTYWATRDQLLRGTLRGGRDARGRLYIERRSVDRLMRQRARASQKQPEGAETAA